MALDVSLAEAIRRAIVSGQADVYTSLPGKVKSYDSSKQLAVITLCVREPVPDSENQEETNWPGLPELPDVPICFTRGGGCYVVHPVAVGDGVMVFFNALDPSGYRTDGNVHSGPNVARHHLSYAWAVPCIGPDSATLQGSAEQAVTIEGPEIRIGVGATEFIAMANKVLDELNSIKAAYDLHTHECPAGTSDVAAPLPAPSSVAATKGKVE